MILFVMYYLAMIVAVLAATIPASFLFYCGQVWQPLVLLLVGACIFHETSKRMYVIKRGEKKVSDD